MNSLSLGQIMGIKIELHATFLWLIVIIVILLSVFAPEIFVPAMILVFFLFLSVFLHELAHSVVAIWKGFKIDKIILLPIGGVAMTEELPEKPADEFLIAVAGPLFNFAVAFLVLFLAFTFPLPFPRELFYGTFDIAAIESAIFAYPLFALFWVNIILGAFNLFLPALPLDGGRVLRSILAAFLGFSKATSAVAKASSFIAIFLFLVGFLAGNLIIAIIAIFIYFGARQENEVAIMKEVLRGTTIENLVERNPVVLEQNLTLIEVYDLMLRENKNSFPVRLEKGFGIVNVEKLSTIEKKRWESTTLSQVCKEIPPLDLSSPTKKALTKILTRNYPLLPVVENGILIGIVRAAEVQKFYELKKLEKLG